MRTERISEDTHAELTKIQGYLMTRDGKKKTFDETIKELIQLWKEKHT